ncbi:Yae1p [Rhodotorula paludigena]|uniref:Yae1p n=1 Tax=Rhodotorula paludigena TaxID=86838 RepID=UPI0031823774
MSIGADAHMLDDDSVWHDDEPSGSSAAPAPLAPLDASSGQISQQEWDKLSSRYSDAGYRDGITAGKNARLQAGFDQGFALAAPYARELGTLRGIAATLLSLLTVPSANATRHAGALLSAVSPETKERAVAELRELVTALGHLDAVKVLPVDEEAEQHAREHEDEGISEVMRERREMREMEALMSGLGGSSVAEKDVQSGQRAAAECRRWLEDVLRVFGLEGALPAIERS